MAAAAAAARAARRLQLKPHKVRWGHSSAENSKDDAVREMEIKLDKAMLEQKHSSELAVVSLRAEIKRECQDMNISSELAVVSLRAEIKRECQDMNMKHQIDMLKVRNDVKAVETQFEVAKAQMQEKLSRGQYERLRNLGWFFGLGTAFAVKFQDLKKIIFG